MIAIATQCFGPDIGGIESLMTALADQVAQSGRKVGVYADRIRTSGAHELSRSYPIHRFNHLRPIRRWMKHRAITQLAQHERIVGVFADSWKSVAAVPAGVGPIAALAHGTEFPLISTGRKGERIRRAFARTQTIVASSHFAASLVEPYLENSAAKVVVVNPPVAALPVAEPAALERMGAVIAGRHPVIMTLARLEPRKGIDMVIKAIRRLKTRHPNLVYLVAGSGPDLERLVRLAEETGASDSVAFLGPVTDLQVKAALLTSSDVHAMPSRRVGTSVEGFGISYVEAGWYGVPSIAGDDGGARDAVADMETGILCNGDDEDDVYLALARLLDDEALRRAYGQAAADAARRRFNWRDALPRYLAALDL